jgi:hypothetical protein
VYYSDPYAFSDSINPFNPCRLLRASGLNESDGLSHTELKSWFIRMGDDERQADEESVLLAPIHCCYTVMLHCYVTLLLHCCYTVVTLLLHYCYTIFTLLLHYCYTVVTLLLHCRMGDDERQGDEEMVGFTHNLNAACTRITSECFDDFVIAFSLSYSYLAPYLYPT